jgi:hypothetical protein
MRLLPESAGADRAPPSPHPGLDDTGAADDEHARHRQQRRLSKLVDDVSSVTQMT